MTAEQEIISDLWRLIEEMIWAGQDIPAFPNFGDRLQDLAERSRPYRVNEARVAENTRLLASATEVSR